MSIRWRKVEGPRKEGRKEEGNNPDNTECPEDIEYLENLVIPDNPENPENPKNPDNPEHIYRI